VGERAHLTHLQGSIQIGGLFLPPQSQAGRGRPHQYSLHVTQEKRTGIMRRQPTCPEIGLEQEPHLAGIWKYLTSPVLSSDERVKRRDMIQNTSESSVICSASGCLCMGVDCVTWYQPNARLYLRMRLVVQRPRNGYRRHFIA
jgi:hypothetical protein